jgi:hypothetical protein
VISVLVLLAVASLDTDEWQREARVWHAAFSLQAPAIPSQAEAELSKLPKRNQKEVSKTRWGLSRRLWLRSCGLGGPRGGPASPRLVTINAIQPPAGSRRLYGQVSDAVRRRVPQGPARNPIFFWQNWHTKGGWHAPRAAFGLQLKAATTRKFWLAAIGQRTVDAHDKEPCPASTSK